MRFALTLVSAAENGLTGAVLDRARALTGGGDVVTLSKGKAADIIFEASHPPPCPIFDDLKIDTFLSPATNRRKKLLLADMDSTIIREETLDEIAAHLGLRDKIAPITERAMRGELDFETALAERVALLKGVTLEDLALVRDKLTLMPGADILVKTMAGQGSRCVLVSGGFDFYTSHIAQRAGFHQDISNRFEMAGDALTGKVLNPVIDKTMKRLALDWELSTQRLSPDDSLAVGDGANDIPLLQAAGIGVAFHAKPAVNAATQYHVKYTDLISLLYLQGYKDVDFILT